MTLSTMESTDRVVASLIATACPTEGRATTDLGNAHRLIDRYGHVLRYLAAENKWLYYNRGTWHRDNAGVVNQLAAETVRMMFQEVAHGRVADADARRAQSARALRNMVSLASHSIPGVAVTPAELDSHPHLLNVANGVVDLTTGVLSAHDPELLFTQQAQAKYDPNGVCPLWESTLATIFAGDRDLMDFFQRAVGYSASGYTREQVLLLAWGTGANGKSTVVETLKTVLGSYAQQAPADLLVDTGRSDSSALHRVNGVRFLACTETPDGRRLSEETVKQLTGGDTIVARPLYGQYVEFRPVLTPWILTNHRPLVSGSEAIWRRLRMIPFTTVIEPQQRDPHLAAKLAVEKDGILTWVVRGAVEWNRVGLSAPDSVTTATSEYRVEQDTLHQFFESNLVPAPGQSVETGKLFARYEAWAEQTGELKVSQKLLSMRLSDKGFTLGKDSRTRRAVVKDHTLS